MQFFSLCLAEVRAVKRTDGNTFDPVIANKSIMEKVIPISNPWYVKKYITLLIFIALVMTVTFLKRMSVTEGDSLLPLPNPHTQQSAKLLEK